MAKKKVRRKPVAKDDSTIRAEVDVLDGRELARQVFELEHVMQELVDAICAVRDGMRKESLEALPPTSRMAMDLALVHAKRLGAKGLEDNVDSPAGKS